MIVFVAWPNHIDSPQIADETSVAVVTDRAELGALVERAMLANLRWVAGPVKGQGFFPDAPDGELEL